MEPQKSKRIGGDGWNGIGAPVSGMRGLFVLVRAGGESGRSEQGVAAYTRLLIGNSPKTAELDDDCSWYSDT